jgi:ABC-2 type transport system permease protein
MRKVWLIARWEFLATVSRASFLVALIALPLFHLGLAALIGLSMQSALRADAAVRPLFVVDPERVLADAESGSDRVVRDEVAALSSLNSGTVDAVVVLDGRFLENGRVRIYARPSTGLFDAGRRIDRRARADAVIRAGLMNIRDGNLRDRRVLEPIVEVDRYRLVADGGRPEREPDSALLSTLAGPFGVCFLLSLSIFLSSGVLQESMAAEVHTRMLEVLLSIIKPTALLAGKTFGLAAAGLLQLGVYLAIVFAAGAWFPGFLGIPWTTAAWAVLCFGAGYGLYAVLMAATGAVTRDSQESVQWASIWMLVGAAPLFMITSISTSPSSMLARSLSWFPLTAPVALMLRMGSGPVSWVEMTIALLLTSATAGFVLVGAAALLRARVQSGGRVVLRKGKGTREKGKD